ncbi:conserved hypothetical protein [Catenulispora acidiphila DSM 44928]|uniref:Uncharacterized protein n=1 Tax=Catenulispora acidiphila (strain DSM 44928 / JCM 14897 / NBRC 102108 / NRRL B-24433 / ID139908) TaxID=479433 RepID=C7QF24_CATAD|nr:hypothetical protein [Catenulispora acidiphila]ACU74782.1 conserved hypothetical protein [Catenulispora acidiphila DSM 44928]
MSPHDFKPVMHPAGFDEPMARILGEVRTGHWFSMAEMLAASGGDRRLRCTRIALLAQVAAASNAVDQWVAERPRDPDAVAMAARVAVERACKAAAKGLAQAQGMGRRAAELCAEAAAMDPADPVPYLGRLALAAGFGERVEGPDSCPVPGPWHAFRDLWRIDPANREGAHRMLSAVGSGAAPSPAAAQLFASSIVSSVGLSSLSPLQLLPLYAIVVAYEYRKAQGDGLAHLLWTTETARTEMARGWNWFASSGKQDWLVVDLSHLAHALVVGGRADLAADVFEAMGPYGSNRPWTVASGSGDAVEEFVRARSTALAAAASRRGGTSGRQRAGP